MLMLMMIVATILVANENKDVVVQASVMQNVTIDSYDEPYFGFDISTAGKLPSDFVIGVSYGMSFKQDSKDTSYYLNSSSSSKVEYDNTNHRQITDIGLIMGNEYIQFNPSVIIASYTMTENKSGPSYESDGSSSSSSRVSETEITEDKSVGFGAGIRGNIPLNDLVSFTIAPKMCWTFDNGDSYHIFKLSSGVTFNF